MKRQHGKHLGIVRSWIQWNALNGSDVTWGSHAGLRFSRTITPAVMETLAQDICDGVVFDIQQDLRPLQRMFERLKPAIEKGVDTLTGDERDSAAFDLLRFEAVMKELLSEE